MTDQAKIEILKKNDATDLLNRIKNKEDFRLDLVLQYCNAVTAIAVFQYHIRNKEFDSIVLPYTFDSCFELQLQPNFKSVVNVFDADMLQKVIVEVYRQVSKDMDDMKNNTLLMSSVYQHLSILVDKLINESSDRSYLNAKNVLTLAIRDCPYNYILLLERLALDWNRPSRDTDNALLAALDRSNNTNFQKFQDKKETTTLISWYSPSGEPGTGSVGKKPQCDDPASITESYDRLKTSSMYSDDEKKKIEEWLKAPTTAPAPTPRRGIVGPGSLY